jgi:hypothetical protein
MLAANHLINLHVSAGGYACKLAYGCALLAWASQKHHFMEQSGWTANLT